MPDFAVKDLMVTVLPARAAQDCSPCDNTDPCDNDTTCEEPSEAPKKEESSQTTERDFKVLDRELRRILDQS